jgi:hypothetical protein
MNNTSLEDKINSLSILVKDLDGAATLELIKSLVRKHIVENTVESMGNKVINLASLETTHAPVSPPDGNPKYDKIIFGKYGTGACIVDAYAVLTAFEVVIPQLQHSIKKELKVGGRGHKSVEQDLIDIRDSTQSALDAFYASQKLNNL